MSSKISWNVVRHSGEWSRRFRRISISIYLMKSCLFFIKFCCWFATKQRKKHNLVSQLLSKSFEGKFSTILLITNLFSLITVFVDYFFLYFTFFSLCRCKRAITVRRVRGIKKPSIILHEGVKKTSKKAASQGDTHEEKDSVKRTLSRTFL